MNVIDLEQYRIEKAAIESALNMGIPDCFYCGLCGNKYLTADEIQEHLEKECNAEA